jgi:hypothetical protein
MNRIIIILFALVTFTANAQEDEARHNLYVGLNAGVDYNFNAYRLSLDHNGFKYYGIDPHYNYALDFGLKVSKRLRTRVEFKFVKMSYGMDWGDYNSTFDKTVTKLYNFDANLHLDYLLLSRNRFRFYISSGLKSEFVIDYKYLRKDNDGSTTEVKYNFTDDEFSKSILGGVMSTIIKYNLNNYIGITLVPEYSIFFRNFIKSNDKNYQRFSTNIGLEFRF